MNTFYFFVLGYSKSNGIGLQMSWSQWVLVKKKKKNIPFRILKVKQIPF